MLLLSGVCVSSIKLSAAGRIAGPRCCCLLNEPDVFAPFFTDADDARDPAGWNPENFTPGR
jgi:hypothetical protein